MIMANGKWYEDKALDSNVVLSSRVRLARNIKGYPFPKRLTPAQAQELVDKVKSAVINDRTPIGQGFTYTDMLKTEKNTKLAMLENHIISPELIQKKLPCGVLTNDENSVDILVNEEDHIRIQSMVSGYNIEKAWEEADRIDNLIAENVKYAYDDEFGYLTACVTNTGTGMRASFMLHLPMLESNGQIARLASNVSKFGITIRGIYGEGSEPLGAVYQISNQITLGKSEKEIIELLKNITPQIIESENSLREQVLKNRYTELADVSYRALGTLKYCLKISSAEAMDLLSKVRLGIISGIIDSNLCKTNIYNAMMNIQGGNLQLRIGHTANEAERDTERAKYLKEIF
jgi:protein arginine kinase